MRALVSFTLITEKVAHQHAQKALHERLCTNQHIPGLDRIMTWTQKKNTIFDTGNLANLQIFRDQEKVSV